MKMKPQPKPELEQVLEAEFLEAEAVELQERNLTPRLLVPEIKPRIISYSK